MARRPRYLLPGVAVHIIQRGVNRAACFRAEADYLVYLSHLRQLSAKHDCAVHAYCLMTNHVHLLVTPGAADSCTRLMRDIGRRYVPYFNRRHERTGTLWEGRFRSCIAESARYVLACYRYIELNPVRAKMVDRPGDYPWSSYAANAGALPDGFIVEHPEFAALASETSKRLAAYTALFDERMDEAELQAIRDATNGGYPLASDAFKARVIAPLGWKTGPGKPGPTAVLTPTPNSTTSCDPDPELVF
jgi:putative transposase